MSVFRPVLGAVAALVLSACATQNVPPERIGASIPVVSPVAQHGDLSVKDGKIIGRTGQQVSLAGPSFFWSTIGWDMDKYYTRDMVDYFVTDWNAGIIRAAISAQNEGSYLTHPDAQTRLASTLVEAAIENGVYVVVDWHSHEAEEHPDAAIAFFTDMATRYGTAPNVIYEIYNEPLDTTDWETEIKPYAYKVIAAIRAVDPDNLIIVGSESWDQRVDKAADSPLTGVTNVAYSLHFYAASHKADLRAKAQYALDKGLPLMITEWGSVAYTGDGAVDKASSTEWMRWAKQNGLSHMSWAVSDKEEGASYFKPGTSATGPWSDADLTAAGRFYRDIIRSWATANAADIAG